MCSYLFLESMGFKNYGFLLSPGVLEGLGSSGDLVGTISTYPGTLHGLFYFLYRFLHATVFV